MSLKHQYLKQKFDLIRLTLVNWPNCSDSFNNDLVCLLTFSFEIKKVKKSDLYHTHGITPRRVTSVVAHLRVVAPGQHSFKETSQRWRAVGDIVSDFTDPGIEPRPSAPIAMS